MKEAVIVSTARTPIGKAFRGGFNNLGGATLGAVSVAEAVRRAGIDPARVEDVIMGSALQQGATGSNIARQIALRAGLPITTSGMTIDRQCSSGLMAVATAAKQVMYDGMDCVIGGGLESISLVQNEHMNLHRMVDDELMAIEPNMFEPMLQTAEIAVSYTHVRAHETVLDIVCRRLIEKKNLLLLTIKDRSSYLKYYSHTVAYT